MLYKIEIKLSPGVAEMGGSPMSMKSSILLEQGLDGHKQKHSAIAFELGS